MKSIEILMLQQNLGGHKFEDDREVEELWENGWSLRTRTAFKDALIVAGILCQIIGIEDN